MSPTAFTFTTSPYDPSEVQLGNLISNKSAPNKDPCHILSLSKDKDFSKKEDANYHFDAPTESSSEVKAILSKIASIFIKGKSSSRLSVSADTSFVYEVLQPKAVFSKMCRAADVRKWLGDVKDVGDDAFLIEGYRTLMNATVWENAEREFEGVFDAKGERIFSIRFRKIKFKIWSGIEGARLKGDSCWAFYTPKLGIADEEDMEWLEVGLETDTEEEKEGK
ncbi:hypothetical protein BDZ45DRAFT_663143 [Acephala macrosclerotiorum]|nr:hypothetical protein BDZ45DRAFT_663143 [Acephala macrosclerotiorum]